MRLLRVLLIAALWMGLLLQQSASSAGSLLGLWLVGATVCCAVFIAIKTRSFRLLLIWTLLLGAKWLILQQWLPALSSLLSQAGLAARTQVAGQVSGVTREATALVLGITDGDTSLLPSAFKEQLKLLSLTHLNAVSGTNCTIIAALILGLLTKLAISRWRKFVLVALVLVLYLVLVGDQPSVLRAMVMAAIMLLARSSGFKYQPIDLLCVACVTLLLMQPELAASLGFALSVSATAGVLVLAPRVEARLRRYLPNYLALGISVAFSAQLFCLPILVSVQSSYSSLGLVANLLAEPLIPLITVLGVVGAAFAIAHLPLALPMFWLASLPAQVIASLTHWLGTNDSRIHWPTQWFGVAIAAALALGLTAAAHPKSRYLKVGIGITALSLLAVLPWQFGGAARGAYPGPNWFYLACNIGQGDATVIRSGSAVALIDVGRDPSLIDDCLSRLQIKSIRLLVLTHFDLDHVGGLAGVLSGRQIKQALVTDYPDARPGAEIAERQLRMRGIAVTHAALGLTGRVGNFDWLVLSPHRGGADSVDSNDGSISMLWVGRQATVFTMADLPASGQIRLMHERVTWWRESFRDRPVVLKLSHHGSADQDPDFLAWVHPLITTISVGVNNGYGHPTQKALNWLASDAKLTLRTDQMGSISISQAKSGLIWSSSGQDSR